MESFMPWMMLCLLFAVGVLNGVIYSTNTFTKDQIAKISSICDKNGGLEKITAEIFYNNIYCKDGAKFRIKDKE